MSELDRLEMALRSEEQAMGEAIYCRYCKHREQVHVANLCTMYVDCCRKSKFIEQTPLMPITRMELCDRVNRGLNCPDYEPCLRKKILDLLRK